MDNNLQVNKSKNNIIIIILISAIIILLAFIVMNYNNIMSNENNSNEETEIIENNNQEATVICKSATKLHTETCTNPRTSLMNENYYGKDCTGEGYSIGSVVTYGNVGTSGVLTTGDAFDCDINGDGIYNSDTERFYYMLDNEVDSNYAVLIYYSNVVNGEPTNTSKNIEISYSNSSDYINHYGPDKAISQLPTVNQWSNLKLINDQRNIKDEKGNIAVSNFAYTGYAARLLTYNELVNACNMTYGTYNPSHNCKFLLEQTYYTNSNDSDMLDSGFYLENVSANNGPYSGVGYVWSINGDVLNLDTSVGNYAYHKIGIRPAIEVLKENMEY